MRNQKINFPTSFSFSVLKNHFTASISLYFFTLGSSILGFSLYLFLETINPSDVAITRWSGEGLFWALIFLLVAIFIVFLPIEFIKVYEIINRTYNDLILNIISIIFTSLLFLLFFQILIPNNSFILSEVTKLTRSISFSGFRILPISFFILNNVGKKFLIIQKYNFSLILLIWMISLQAFL